ncbi:MAG TPA: phosphocholine cytidylyltransferase family protein [Allosphingosinicella sp.]|nr:phosphocholine cytidylyltransferase family protein [Allosphingosinicella sp.]
MTAGKTIGRAVILSAGKGSRLLPLTADRPKCLLDLSGRSLLEWQLDSLYEAGVTEMAVVVGFKPDLVEAVLAGRDPERGRVTTIFNPFYHVADNLGSVWMARSAMDRDCLLLNGDTLVPPALIERLAGAPASPVCVTVDEKAEYDADDMKVLRDGDRLVRVDKGLPRGGYNAEAIGLHRFMSEGRTAFLEGVERMLRTPEGTASFYLRVIDRLADTGVVTTVSAAGLAWAEVDFPTDLEAARRLTDRWAAAASGTAPPWAEPIA